ncbi:DUF58 domain-containing protein [Cohnella sp. GCM10027633]|uniref:DUF58 domain-containing protein n=1 Tax=unclassified Cohnella TaxID=2636738 RepID=UPI0036345D2A
MAIILWIVIVLVAMYQLQRLAYRYYGMRSVAYDRSFSSSRVFAGETVWLSEKIANRKRLPLPWLRVETLMPAQLVFKQQEADTSINRGDQLQNHASLFSIPSYTEIVRKHEVLCPQRGCYAVSSYTISMGDMIGWQVKSEARTPATSELVVYPKLMALNDLPLSARRYVYSVRSMLSPIREDHYHVAGVRPYRDGDSFRLVNWSATAKTGELLVHRRESMCDNDLTLLVNAEMLDHSNNRRLTKEQFERALSYAASAAQYLIAGGGKAGIIYNGAVSGHADPVFRLPVKGGAAHLEVMLEAMARFEPATKLGMNYLLERLVAERSRGMNVLFVTGFIDAAQEALVKQLRQNGNAVEVLLLYKEAAS